MRSERGRLDLTRRQFVPPFGFAWCLGLSDGIAGIFAASRVCADGWRFSTSLEPALVFAAILAVCPLTDVGRFGTI